MGLAQNSLTGSGMAPNKTGNATIQSIAQPNTHFSLLGQSNGGGTNAQGSPKTVATINNGIGNGMFQYGDNQYGYLNPHGAIDWSVTGNSYNKWLANHRGGALDYGRVSNFAHNRGLTVPTSNPRAPYFLDSLYASNMVSPENQLAQEKAQGTQDLSNLANQYQEWNTQNTEQADQQKQQLRSQIGASGFDPGAGVGAGSMVNLQNQLVDTLNQYMTQYNAQKNNDTSAMGLAQTAFDKTKAAQLGDAKDRFDNTAALGGPQAPNLPKGFTQKNGQWYFTNKNGVTVSAKHGPKGKNK